MAASIYVSPFLPALLLQAPPGVPAQGFSPVPEHRRPTVPAALLVRQTRVRLWNQTAAVSVPRYRLWPRPAGLALPSALPPVGTSRAVLVPTASALRPVPLWLVVLPLTRLPGSARTPRSQSLAGCIVSVFRYPGS